MDDLETGKDKIKKICEILKNESLEPAKQEAQRVIEVSQNQAHEMLREAERRAYAIIEDARKKMAKEKELFEQSLAAGSKQAIESLRQEIENSLFNQEIASFVEGATKDEKVAAELITALVKAIEKEGTSADFSALIPQSLPPEKVNRLIAKEILEKLREKSCVMGDFLGGVQVKLHDRKLLLDVSDSSLKELLGKYLRKDFRNLLFAN
jgi:V/A-type H+-transporting ATPase subunit E